MREKLLSFEEYKHSNQGFTLVEMAIVMVIIGLLMATVIGFATTTRKSAQVTTTNSREQIIKIALTTFLSRNNRLPCPAVATLAPTANGYGVEATPASDVTSCQGIAPSVATSGVNVVAGIVPWISLGLTDDEGTDGYYNRFTYQVVQTATYTAPAFTTLAPAGTAQTVSAMEGAISIHSTTPATMGLAPAGNQTNVCTNGNYNPCLAVAIIVSHGSNGYYAYTRQGNQLAGIGGTDELENGNADSKFVMKDFVDSTANPFDDIVLPMTTDDLLAPLINNGSIQSYQAVLQSDFNQLTASIVTTAISNRSLIPGATATCGVVFGLAHPLATYYYLAVPAAVNDPWGNPIQVTIPAGTSPICSGSSASTTAFTLTSKGPDGVLNTADDITSTVQVSALQAAFTTSGW